MEVTTPTIDAPTQAVPRRARKRQRHNFKAVEPLAPCLITTLPVELLAEILQFTESPRDVLAVARSCKRFCDILVHPAQSFIWKTVRQLYPVPPPDPMSVFSEVGYASFIFDGGNCTVCGKYTDKPFYIFGIRVRLCEPDGHDCRLKLEGYFHPFNLTPTRTPDGPLAETLYTVRRNTDLGTKLLEVLPYRETGAQNDPRYVTVRWFPELALPQDHLDAYLQSKASHKEKVAAYMTLCHLLKDWTKHVQTKRVAIKCHNSTLLHDSSVKYGWDKNDLKHLTQFGVLLRIKNTRLENIEQADFDKIKDEVDNELIKLAEKRRNRNAVNLFKENYYDVARHFNRLRSGSEHPILPPLPTFRQLPIISMLQGKPHSSETPKPIGTSFKDSEWVKTQLQSNLDAWREKARNGLASVLGFPNWKTAIKTTLHPVERVTARFRCKRCSKVPSKYRKDECFDFAGACAHDCGAIKKNSKALWKAENFVKDEKAIAVIEQLAQLTNVDTSLAGDNILVTVRNIVCTSCRPPLMMDWKCLVGHSHRHDRMQLRIASATEDLLLMTFKIKHGIVEEHTRPGQHALKSRQAIINGCRHCTFARVDSSAIEIPPNISPPMLFSFDGLRSHLKAKHHIENIRDEDVIPKT